MAESDPKDNNLFHRYRPDAPNTPAKSKWKCPQCEKFFTKVRLANHLHTHKE